MLVINFLIIVILVLADNIASEAPLSKLILPNIESENTNNKISECTIHISKEHISCNGTIFIVSSGNYQDFLLRSINADPCFSLVTRTFAGQRWLVYPDIYIILANNVTDFLKGTREISKDLSWNPKAKFLILFRNKVNDITEIFQELMTIMIFDVAVITYTETNELEVFTYFPNNGEDCGQNVSDVRSMGRCPNISKTLFPNKFPNGLRNYTLTVAAREDVPYVLANNSEYTKYLEIGVEQYVLNTIAEYTGIHLKYNFISSDEDYGVILPNRTATGLLGYLQRHEADIIAGGLFLSGNRLEVFNYVYGYSYAMFSVFTPVLQEKRWSRVYQQFSVCTWLLIILSFFFTVFVILMTKALTAGKINDEFLVILKLWRYFYGQADARLFKDSYIQRFLIVWIIFTSSIYAFYNTASYSLITGHVQDVIRVNHSDLASLPFKPCISESTRIFYHSAYNEILPKGDDRYYSKCRNTNTAFRSVAVRTDLYTVDTDYIYYFEAIKYLDSEGQPTVKKSDYPRTDILTMYLTKGFPIRKEFQKYVLRIYETGLLQRHLSSLYSRKPQAVPTLKRKYKVIRLEDFRIHYSILLIGIIISFICFIIEYKTG